MPSALTALGVDIPLGLDGSSFLETASRARLSDSHLARQRPDDERGAESAVA
jgi:hypothetical protein